MSKETTTTSKSAANTTLAAPSSSNYEETTYKTKQKRSTITKHFTIKYTNTNKITQVSTPTTRSESNSLEINKKLKELFD